MRIKLEKSGGVNMHGYGSTIKITMPDGSIRYKNVDPRVRSAVECRENIEVSNTPLPGFRKYAMSRIKGGYETNCNVIANYDSVYVCKRGLRDIGFGNVEYLYVKFGRKV